jgi:hypothetical protein
MSISLNQLEAWLSKELEEYLRTTTKETSSFQKTLDLALRQLKDICNDILKKSEKDMIERKKEPAFYRAARAANRMSHEISDTVSATVVKADLSYQGLKTFHDNVEKLLTSATRTRDRWAPQIRPYYILDMMSLNGSIEKLKRLTNSLREFQSKKAPTLRAVEDIHAKIAQIEQLHREDEAANQTVVDLKKKLSEIEEASIDNHNAYHKITEDQRIQTLLETERRLIELRGELTSSGLSHLGRPLRKFLSTVERGEFFLQPEYKQPITDYLNAPLRTFLKEKEGYPVLKMILLNVQKAIQDKKLGIKEKKAKRVLAQIDAIVNKNSLDRIYAEGSRLIAKRREELANASVSEMYRERVSLRKEIDELKRRKNEILKRIQGIEEEAKMRDRRIREHTMLVERGANEVTGKQITINTA